MFTFAFLWRSDHKRKKKLSRTFSATKKKRKTKRTPILLLQIIYREYEKKTFRLA